jgi:hypothetical protein
MRRVLLLLLTTFVLPGAILIAACGSPDQPRVASAATDHAATAAGSAGGASAVPSAPSAPTDYDKALAYTRCMTANGAPSRDPVEGEPLVTYNMLRPGEDAASYQTRRDAHQKCRHHLPVAWPVRWDPKEIARSQRYIECMREHGITQSWPDANGLAQEPTDDAFRSSPEYQAAVRACRHLVDDPANDQPENK